MAADADWRVQVNKLARITEISDAVDSAVYQGKNTAVIRRGVDILIAYVVDLEERIERLENERESSQSSTTTRPA